MNKTTLWRPWRGAALAVLLGAAPAAAQVSQPAAADGWRPCGSAELQQEFLRQHPDAQRAFDAHFQAAQAAARGADAQARVAPDVTVPVVVHVLHQGGASNVSDRQIQSFIDRINTDYAKLNADTVDIIPLFQPIIANVGFRFRLARIDPQGNCTNGITRHFTDETTRGTAAVANVVYWDPLKYLNVWVVDAISSGAGGYTFGGLCAGQVDGIVIRRQQFGEIANCNLCTRSMTHEIGHYFSLAHTWGRSNTPGVASNCNLDDGIADTPNTVGVTGGGCPLGQNTCGPIANVQNYMDYADCEKMFTLGQRAAMRATLTSTDPVFSCRQGLTSQANLVATGTNDGYVPPANGCAPVVAFEATPSTVVCENGTVTFRDYSYNYSPAAGGPLTYSWSFPGGQPATANTSAPTVTYPAAGIYPVTLTLSNAAGSGTLTRTQLIQVQGPSTGEQAPLLESFESAGFPNNFPAPNLRNWTASSSSQVGSVRWARTTVGTAFDGTAFLQSTTSNTGLLTAGTTTTLVSPNINLAASTSPSTTVSFARSYGLLNANVNDRLDVSFSVDCGATWSTPAASFTATQLNTLGAPLGAGGSAPQSAADWQTLSVPIPVAFLNSPKFQVRLQWVNGSTPGYPLYLDAFRVSGPTATRADQLAQRGIALYPNPQTQETALHLALPKATQVALRLTDVLGREVARSAAKTYAAGQQAVALPAAAQHLPAGVYVVRIALDGETFATKLTVE